jgi:hypothetical protein
MSGGSSPRGKIRASAASSLPTGWPDALPMNTALAVKIPRGSRAGSE